MIFFNFKNKKYEDYDDWNAFTKKEEIIIYKYLKNQHGYHIVKSSPWPLLTGYGLLCFIGFIISMFNGYKGGPCMSVFSFILFLIGFTMWIRDIIRELTMSGKNTWKVRHSLMLGFILFIISELMFFSGFFWGFFHSSIISTVWLFENWPPQGIIVFNPTTIPLINTIILLLSGIAVTWSHQELLNENRKKSIYALIITIFLGILFIFLQAFEYITALYNLSDGVYPSVFYMATAFHGLHVFIGIIFLMVCLKRIIFFEITPVYHLNFEFAAWYWHFVDVIWLFLYLFFYIWGSNFLYKY